MIRQVLCAVGFLTMLAVSFLLGVFTGVDIADVQNLRRNRPRKALF